MCSTRRRVFLFGSFSSALAMVSSTRASSRPVNALEMFAQLARNMEGGGVEQMVAEDAVGARIKAISNVFEVGKPEPEYDYVEWLNDGRGYTVTNYGFCTGTGEVATIIRRYAAAEPSTPLRSFVELMPPVSSGKHTLSGFPAAWREAVRASLRLITTCEEEANRLFYNPAMAEAAKANIKSPVGKLIFYDTWLQHGGGDDPDSFSAIYARACESLSNDASFVESDFLRTFLTIRKSVLRDPAEISTRSVWRQSALRVDALLAILDTNPNLVPPVLVANAEVYAVVG